MGHKLSLIDQKSRAYTILSSYEALLRSHGYDIAVHSTQAWEKFDTYPQETQKLLIDRFAAQFSVITELSENKTDFRDPIQSVWRVLQKFNWKPPHDLFQRLTKNDIVEIYLPDQTQLYRNLDYFKYTSYSLSELLFYPWHELFEHQAGFHEKLSQILNAIFTQQVPDDYHDFSMPYIGRERFSKNKFNVKLYCKALSPLKCRLTGTNEAMIVIWNIDLLNDRKTISEQDIQVGGFIEKEITC